MNTKNEEIIKSIEIEWLNQMNKLINKGLDDRDLPIAEIKFWKAQYRKLLYREKVLI